MKKLFHLFTFFAILPLLHAQTASNSCSEADMATHITGPGTFSVGDIDGASPGSGLICTGGNVPSNAEWFAYTPSAGFNVTVSSDLSQNGDKDTRLHIYSGTCGTLDCLAGDDDGGTFEGTNGNSYLSVASFIAFPGETYYIAWDNRYTSGNNFDFELTEDPLPPVSFTAQSLPTSGTRRGAVDMNGDFLDDVVTIPQNTSAPPQAIGVNIYYQQPDGTISTTAANYPITPTYNPSWSLAAGDYDSNGFNDLVFGSTNGVTVLQANATGTAYTNAYTNVGVFTQRTNFVDFNNDGNLDVFVCHDQAPNVYYINDGSNNLDFYQGADSAGIPEGLGIYPSGGNYGSIWIDYDNDLDMDMFMAKCGGETARRTNQLFRNDGDYVADNNPTNVFTFTEVGITEGLANPMQTWSSAWADYDNDGDMDVFIGSYSSGDDHSFMENRTGETIPMGETLFHDITASTGLLSFSQRGIENVAHDFNNDGLIDIISNGKILLNKGGLIFEELTDLGLPSSYAIGDLNNDGYLDVYGSQIHYNSSQYTGNNWLKIYTIGKSYDTANKSNRNGIGARIEINTSSGTQIRDVRSGDGFRFMGSLNTHFGIGSDTVINSVTVYWPSGVVDLIVNPAINGAVTITEGDTLGLPDSGITDLILYPNPTKDVLNLNTSLNLSDAIYSVFDLNGKRLLNSRLKSSTINVSSLAAGNYLLRIISEGKQTIQKFIKQ